jgi:hypothetical protein
VISATSVVVSVLELASGLPGVPSNDHLCKVDSNRYDCHDSYFCPAVALMKNLVPMAWQFSGVNRNPHRVSFADEARISFIL